MCDSTQVLTDIETQPNTETNLNHDNDESLVWGRLFPASSVFKQIELKKDLLVVGRKPECDFILNVDSAHCVATAYSSIHFKIRREFSGKTGCIAFIEDHSSNGTFVDGEKIGKGRVQALKNCAEIALAKKENKAFVFIDLSSKDDKKYPNEVKEKYTITKLLGSGAFGEVRLGFHKETCNKYAIKIIPKKKFSINNSFNRQILSEAEILKKLEHPCIIKIHEVFDTDANVFMVLDLVEGGELVVQIGQYDESTAKLLFYQMTLAIKYLHDNNISHRDLKPENILLSSADKTESLIKITDFGLSKFFDGANIMKTYCGTPNYLAPEVISNRGEGNYTNKIDNWSLGVILYICLVGYPPFEDDNSKLPLETQIKRGMYEFQDQYWSGISPQAKDVVKRLMCVDPSKRATLEEILEHEWIKSDTKMKEKAHKLMNLPLVEPVKDEDSNEKMDCDTKREYDINANELPRKKRFRAL